MSLGARIMAGMAVVVSALAAGSIAISRGAVLRSHIQLEEKLLRRNVDRVIAAMAGDIENLATLARDWAERDDTVDFLEGRNTESYIKANLSDEIFRNLKVQVLFLFREDGSLVYGVHRDPVSGERLPCEELARIVRRETLDAGNGKKIASRGVSGVLRERGMLLQIVARPVVKSDGRGPARGTLAMGRYLTEATLSDMGRRLSLEISVEDPNGTRAMPAESGLEQSRAVRIDRFSEERIEGRTLIRDLSGRPAGVLAVAMPREVYAQGLVAFRFIGAWIAAIAAVVLACTMLLVSRLVLRPLHDSLLWLRQGVEQIRAQADLSARLRSAAGNEVAEVGIAINEMLSALEAAERAADRQKQELYQAHKLTSLGTLVSGIAHEISNPNNVVTLNVDSLESFFRGALEILDEEHGRNPSLRIGARPYSEAREQIPALLAEMREASAKISRLIEELKHFARPADRGEMGPVRIESVIESALVLLRHTIKSSTDRFTLQMEDGAPPVRGNAQKLEQVVVNIVQNACQALRSRDEAVQVQTAFDAAAGRVRIIVRDEGRGIPAENLSRLGDPFFTTRREQGGTGLGLSITAKIIADHGGAIRFESEPGRGTVVTVELPVWKEAWT